MSTPPKRPPLIVSDDNYYLAHDIDPMIDVKDREIAELVQKLELAYEALTTPSTGVEFDLYVEAIFYAIQKAKHATPPDTSNGGE